MEIISFIVSSVILILITVFIPSIVRSARLTKEYAIMFDPEKVKSYVSLMNEKHDIELTENQKKHIQNLNKLVLFRDKIRDDYNKLLAETTHYLRNLDVEDKEAFIKKHFPSHANYFMATVLGKPYVE